MSRVVALLTDPQVSHTTWRITRPFDYLRKLGNKIHYIHGKQFGNSDGVIFSVELVLSISKLIENIDVLVLPRMQISVELRDACLEWFKALRNSGVFIVYETDDDIYSEAWSDHWFRCTDNILLTTQKKLESIENRWILNQVDGITVATTHLASVIKRYTDTPVVILKNAIDVDAFENGLKERFEWEGQFTLGWSGGFRPESDAVDVSIAWSSIAHKYPYVKFVIAGHVPNVLKHCVPQDRLYIVPYHTMDNYPSGMQVTIGCCSVSNTEFNKSRGPGKAMEYGLAGAAVVATSLVYEEIIYNREFGLLANNSEEWTDQLSLLIENKDLRTQLAYNLNNLVKCDFSLKNNAWKWLKAYEDLVALSTRTIRV